MTSTLRRTEGRSAGKTLTDRKKLSPKQHTLPGADIISFRNYGPLVTRRVLSGTANNTQFTTRDLLHLLGFDQADIIQQRVGPHQALRFNLSGGAWDAETGGGLAVHNEAVLNEHGELRELIMRLTTVHPSGMTEERDLFRLKLKAERHYLHIAELSFAGQALDIHRGEVVHRALGAISTINNALRSGTTAQPIHDQSDFPDLGKILGTEYRLTQELGARLDLPGIKSEGGFNFLAEPLSTQDNHEPLRLPAVALEPLLGIGRNDLETYRNLNDGHSVVQADPQHGGLFRCEATCGGNSLAINIVPLQQDQDQAARQLAKISWHEADGQAVITELKCLDEDYLTRSEPVRHAILGVINTVLRDLRERRYPKIADALARYNQAQLVNGHQFHHGELTQQPQMAVTVLGGAQPREIIPGFGADIGANSTMLTWSRRLKNGQISRAHFMVDGGVGFCKLNDVIKSDLGNWERMMPNWLPFFRNLQGFALTHLHEDHTGAVIDFCRYGLLKNIPCYATTLICRVMQTKLKKARVPAELWPDFHETNESSAIDIVDQDGLLGTVDFLPRMFRHSTENSAILAAAAPYVMDHTGQPLQAKPTLNPNYWNLLLTGDVAFGEICLPNYQGPLPPDLGFKRHYLQDWSERHQQRFPGLQRFQYRLSEASAMITEGTSIHRSGFAPHIMDVFCNQNLLRDWFSEYGEINAILSTATATIEMALWKATQHGMLLTAAGSFLEDRVRDLNIAGVNYDVLLPTGKGGENNRYLEYYAAQLGVPPTTIHDRSSKKIREAIYNDPSKLLILITGTQNTVIEKDAVAIQIAQLRSFLQSDPKWRRAGMGLDVGLFVIGFLQAAIPGNDESQLQLIRELCSDLNVTVYAAVHDGTQFFNVKEPALGRMKADLDRLGFKYRVTGQNEIYIHDFAVYAPGHGWREDFRQVMLPWVRDNGISKVGFIHYSNDYNARVGRELATEAGIMPLPQLVDGRTMVLTQLGRRVHVSDGPVSYILGREDRRPDLYHGGVSEHKVFHVLQPDGSGRQAGLNLAGSKIYLSDFGLTRGDELMHQSAAPPVRRRDQMSEHWIVEAPANNQKPAVPQAGMIFSDMPRSPFAGPSTLRERQNATALLKLAA